MEQSREGEHTMGCRLPKRGDTRARGNYQQLGMEIRGRITIAATPHRERHQTGANSL